MHGELWTPGANWATTLEVDGPIELDGHPVEPGRYSVWMRVVEGAPWSLVLNREPRLCHDQPVPEDLNVLEFDVQPVQGGHMEALAWATR